MNTRQQNPIQKQFRVRYLHIPKAIQMSVSKNEAIIVVKS